MTECKKNNDVDTKPNSQFLLIDCGSEVREQPLDFANEEAIGIRLSWKISNRAILSLELRKKDSMY